LVYIYVDEAGDTGLSPKSRRFYSLAFVYCKDPHKLTSHLSWHLRYTHKVNIYPKCLNELKFALPEGKLKKYYSQKEINYFKNNMLIIRSRILEIINEHSDGFFIAVVDKSSIRFPSWTSERLYNYVFGTTLIHNVFDVINPKVDPVLIFDGGRIDKSKELHLMGYLSKKDSFSKRFTSYSGCLNSINPVESQTEPCNWAADFLSGSVLNVFAKNDCLYWNKIDRNKFIGNGLRMFW
jgi:hypothetical protein